MNNIISILFLLGCLWLVISFIKRKISKNKVAAKLVMAIDKNGDNILAQYRKLASSFNQLAGPMGDFASKNNPDFMKFYEIGTQNEPYVFVWENEEYWFISDKTVFSGATQLNGRTPLARLLFSSRFVNKDFIFFVDKKNPLRYYEYHELPTAITDYQIQYDGYTITEKGNEIWNKKQI